MKKVYTSKELDKRMEKLFTKELEDKIEFVSKKIGQRLWLGMNALGIANLSNLNFTNLIEINGLENIKKYLDEAIVK